MTRQKYKQAVAIYPEHSLAYCNWGSALFNLKRYEHAIEKFKKTIEINPEHALAHKYLGDALFKLERYDDAIENFRVYIKIGPKGSLADAAKEKIEYLTAKIV